MFGLFNEMEIQVWYYQVSIFIVGHKTIELNPVIKLRNSEFANSDSMEILGKTYSSSGKPTDHLFNRMQKCRNDLHSAGFKNPQL